MTHNAWVIASRRPNLRLQTDAQPPGVRLLAGWLSGSLGGDSGTMLIVPYYAFILCGALAALLFLILFFRTKQAIKLLSAFLWTVPIAYDTWVIRTCSGECKIRVDLLVKLPLEKVVHNFYVVLCSEGIQTPCRS